MKEPISEKKNDKIMNYFVLSLVQNWDAKFIYYPRPLSHLATSLTYTLCVGRSRIPRPCSDLVQWP